MTVLEATLVGVSKNIKDLIAEPANVVEGYYQKLVADPEFSDAALREGLAKKPRVVARLARAVNIFAGK